MENNQIQEIIDLSERALYLEGESAEELGTTMQAINTLAHEVKRQLDQWQIMCHQAYGSTEFKINHGRSYE